MNQIMPPAAATAPRAEALGIDDISTHPSMAGALNMARRAAASRATPPVSVLITGETGTGKELLARAIHNESPRKHGPFIAINCSGIPETLLESELFGYKQGAFTGAVRDKRGMFGAAEGGTLFLDEIGDMPMASQAKLLRVLQEHEYTPLGSTQPQRTNVRIITATHRDLEKAIAKSKFRSDLYYRLSAVPIHLPPLRERPEDTLRLAEELCERYNAEEGRKSAGFQESARKAMAEYSWPGNVRELQNVVQRAVIMTDEGQPIGLEYVRVENMRELQNIIQRSGMATEEGRQRPILVPEHAKIASPQDKDDLPVLAGAENKSGDIISLNSNKIIAAEEAGMGADAEPVSSAPPPPANPPVISDAPAPPVPVAASSPTEFIPAVVDTPVAAVTVAEASSSAPVDALPPIADKPVSIPAPAISSVPAESLPPVADDKPPVLSASALDAAAEASSIGPATPLALPSSEAAMERSFVLLVREDGTRKSLDEIVGETYATTIRAARGNIAEAARMLQTHWKTARKHIAKASLPKAFSSPESLPAHSVVFLTEKDGSWKSIGQIKDEACAVTHAFAQGNVAQAAGLLGICSDSMRRKIADHLSRTPSAESDNIIPQPPQKQNNDWRAATGQFIRDVRYEKGDNVRDVVSDVTIPHLTNPKVWREIEAGSPNIAPNLFRAAIQETCRLYAIAPDAGEPKRLLGLMQSEAGIQLERQPLPGSEKKPVAGPQNAAGLWSHPFFQAAPEMTGKLQARRNISTQADIARLLYERGHHKNIHAAQSALSGFLNSSGQEFGKAGMASAPPMAVHIASLVNMTPQEAFLTLAVEQEKGGGKKRPEAESLRKDNHRSESTAPRPKGNPGKPLINYLFFQSATELTARLKERGIRTMADLSKDLVQRGKYANTNSANTGLWKFLKQWEDLSAKTSPLLTPVVESIISECGGFSPHETKALWGGWVAERIQQANHYAPEPPTGHSGPGTPLPESKPA